MSSYKPIFDRLKEIVKISKNKSDIRLAQIIMDKYINALSENAKTHNTLLEIQAKTLIHKYFPEKPYEDIIRKAKDQINW